MSDWRIKSALPTDGEMLLFALTGGFSSLTPTEKDYVIEHDESGETRHVTAYSRDELGRRIADGEFDDD